jgi:hypothetical protein
MTSITRFTAPLLGAALALPALLMQAGTARADAIDGDWCLGDGSRLTINGPDITTPAGRQLKGDYDRHHFTYVEPSGGTVSMVLVSEIQMRLKPPAGDEQLWRRCGKPIS